jgi:hypothetical protein
MVPRMASCGDDGARITEVMVVSCLVVEMDLELER